MTRDARVNPSSVQLGRTRRMLSRRHSTHAPGMPAMLSRAASRGKKRVRLRTDEHLETSQNTLDFEQPTLSLLRLFHADYHDIRSAIQGQPLLVRKHGANAVPCGQAHV